MTEAPSRLAAPFALLLAMAATAGASPPPPRPAELQAAKALHDRAVTDYNLGRFDRAVLNFTAAYELVPDPVLLFDIAQAHRRRDDLPHAIFFYKRFLETASTSPPDREDVRARIGEVTRRVADLERQLADRQEAERARRAAAAAPPPTTAGKPPELALATAGDDDAAIAGRRLVLELDGGVSALRVALRQASGWDQPLVAVLRLGGRYHLGEHHHLGLVGSVSPVGYWDQRRPGQRGGSLLSGLLATFGARTAVGRRLAVAGEVGGGLLFWSGLGDGNPLTAAAQKTVVLPSAYVGAAVSWDLARGLSLRVRPGYTVSAAGATALGAAARRLDQLEIVVGIGYAIR